MKQAFAEDILKAVVFNLGCKTNRYESDAIAEELRERGFEVSESLDVADVYVLNTCAVTAEAERKSRQAVSRIKAKNPAARVYVCGCASEKSPTSFRKDGVKTIIGTAGKRTLAREIIKDLSEETTEIGVVKKEIIPPEYEEFETLPLVNRTRSELKIQDGCDNFCSYCIIPYLRGRSRSRPSEAVLKEAEALSDKTREIILTGINLSAYGKDVGTDLPALIRSLQGIDTRIRLGSFYVEGVTDALLDALLKLKRFCPHFHLSLQSGDDAVLKEMNRKYKTKDYSAAVAKIRAAFPEAGITTDVITAYPTETEASHKNTLAFLKETAFSDIHVFVYSRREGTKAAALKEHPDETKRRRKAELLALKAELERAFREKNLGREQKLLVEEQVDGEYVGYSENYTRIYTKSPEPLQTVVPKILYKDGIK